MGKRTDTRMTRAQARPAGFGVALFLALLAAACASTQTAQKRAAPPPENADAFFPLALGWKWAFEVEKGGEKILATYAVVERLGDTAVVRAGEERNAYAVGPDGISRRDGLGPSDFVLRNPIRAGAEWTLAGGKARVVAVGESVTVPAGSFANCATVEETRSEPDRVLRTVYAPGVGPLSLEYQVSDAVTRRFEVVLRARLLGVTRPGEDPLGGEAGANPPP